MPNILSNRWLKRFCHAAVVILAVVLSITFFGSTDYQVHGVSLKMYVKPSFDGQSYLKLPPLGDLSANTHRGPVDFFVELKAVHPDIIEKGFSTADSQEEWLGGIQSEVKRNLVLFLLKQALVGAVGAAVLYLIVFRPRWLKLLAVFLFSLMLTTGILGYCASTYNIEAFKEPQYTGVVSAGPEVLHLADKLYDKFQNFRGTTDEVVASINTLFSNIEGLDMLAATGEDEVKVLIVSDISNNPVGIQLVQTLADSFKVDMVIDAGDLTDFGSPLEAQTFGKIGSLGVPYLFAPGNHDSPEVAAFLRQFPNVRILEGSLVKTHGLSILGVPDPWSYGSAVNGSSEEEISMVLEKQIQSLKAKLEENDHVDIAVIHNPSLITKKDTSITGMAPVIVSGHTHKLSIKQAGGSFLLNPGTTGASGFRGLQAEEMFYSALILHMDSKTREKAVVDIIQYDPLSSSITVERRLLQQTPPESQA